MATLSLASILCRTAAPAPSCSSRPRRVPPLIAAPASHRSRVIAAASDPKAAQGKDFAVRAEADGECDLADARDEEKSPHTMIFLRVLKLYMSSSARGVLMLLWCAQALDACRGLEGQALEDCWASFNCDVNKVTDHYSKVAGIPGTKVQEGKDAKPADES
eukprot:CAMPEP_0117653058 /NCGR_PEP_ID=MMETSP0804-20121206/2984_1 /TAXON_ID=1074897 /ORGANISM="Tetraselmis astigmatica, Strain CCMP880" /LENGTH=160 /DNA_ID=CAMNT_0005459199 /DNA_START=101 /DNA_END=584 /DNA_ORIENTATION=-